MNPEKNIEIVKRFTEEVINQHKFELLNELWAEDMQWHGGSMGELNGLEMYRKFLSSSVDGAFTNMKLEIIHAVGHGDMVALHFTNSGCNSGSFLGKEPTGKDAKWNGMGFYRLREDKIAEAWFSEDLLQMFLQLGIIKL